MARVDGDSIDSLIGSSDVSIDKAEHSSTTGRVTITWSGRAAPSVYPSIMLRDCCPCEKCFSPAVNSRLILFENLLSSACDLSQITYQNEAITMKWKDGHESVYSAEWLYRRRLESEGTRERLEKLYTNVVDTPWTSIVPGEIISSGNYDEILGTPAKIVEFIECMIRDGVYVIKGAPQEHCLCEFLNKIGAKHQGTHYGNNEWAIKNNPASKDLPNSSKKLELHIDMPYLTKPQQLQLLHCMVQSADGGENKLSDALKAALILKEQRPDYYKILSTVEVDFQFIKSYSTGKKWFICNRAPVIQEDPKSGLPTLCRFAAEVRCSCFNQPIELIESWFEAFRYFWKILEDNSILIKSQPGDILAFNNGRVMHAREAFNSQQERQLEGVYAEWDYLMSAWRSAKVKLNRQQ